MDLVLISHAEIDEKATLIAELNNQVRPVESPSTLTVLGDGAERAHPTSSLGPGSPPLPHRH